MKEFSLFKLKKKLKKKKKNAGEAQDGSLEKNSQVSSEVLRLGSVSIQAEVEMWSHPEHMRIKRDL